MTVMRMTRTTHWRGCPGKSTITSGAPTAGAGTAGAVAAGSPGIRIVITNKSLFFQASQEVQLLRPKRRQQQSATTGQPKQEVCSYGQAPTAAEGRGGDGGGGEQQAPRGALQVKVQGQVPKPGERGNCRKNINGSNCNSDVNFPFPLIQILCTLLLYNADEGSQMPEIHAKIDSHETELDRVTTCILFFPFHPGRAAEAPSLPSLPPRLRRLRSRRPPLPGWGGAPEAGEGEEGGRRRGRIQEEEHGRGIQWERGGGDEKVGRKKNGVDRWKKCIATLRRYDAHFRFNYT